jgi:hypothetical protein
MISLEIANIRPVNTFMEADNIEGKQSIRVTKDPMVIAFDEATFARLLEADFKNGIIEAKVLSRLLEDAPEFAEDLSALLSELMRVIPNSSVFISARRMAEPKTRCEETTQHNISPIQITSLIVSGKNHLKNMNPTRTWD